MFIISISFTFRKKVFVVNVTLFLLQVLGWEVSATDLERKAQVQVEHLYLLYVEPRAQYMRI